MRKGHKMHFNLVKERTYPGNGEQYILELTNRISRNW
jgi:hypothetical protein